MDIEPNQPSVLVVDDAPANLVAMHAVLKPLDLDVVDAASGAEALEQVAKRAFAVALIDVRMPVMDGFELAKRLRETPNGRELPIVFVTANHDHESYIRQGYAAGGADYLTKPLDPDVVRARVRAFVELFKQRERVRESQVGERTRERDDALEQLAQMLQRERDARREAEIANAAKDDFIAIASHELRTPLTAILGWAVLARKLPCGPELAAALKTIERNARAQVRLLEDLLDASRAREGTLRLEVDDVSVDDVIENAVDALRPLANQKHVCVATDATTAGAIRADGERLKQIVSNLLTNAIKFTPAGGHVAVTRQRDPDKVVIEVHDDGEGIEPDFLPHVFEPFRQADASPSRRHGGLGLGLAITKQLVDAHGGTIRARSVGVGHGATFIVELPT